MSLDAMLSNGTCIRCAECGATLTPFELETPSGTSAPQRGFSADQLQLPGYTILRQIGQGGMGIVLEARQHSLDRKVAIKVLLPQLAKDRVFENRFEREAAALARLNHPHIVAIYERGRLHELIYFTMEYVEGRGSAAPEDLRQFMTKAAPLDSHTIQRLVLEIAGALAFAHDQGIVHRDVKPSNVMIDRHGRAKLTDFGIAAVANDASKLQLTGDNALMGTPYYMAPEQRRWGYSTLVANLPDDLRSYLGADNWSVIRSFVVLLIHLLISVGATLAILGSASGKSASRDQACYGWIAAVKARVQGLFR